MGVGFSQLEMFVQSTFPRLFETCTFEYSRAGDAPIAFEEQVSLMPLWLDIDLNFS